MTINNQFKTDYYFNIAGCIPGVKEVSGMIRAGKGCYGVAYGVFADLRDKMREGSSLPSTPINKNSYDSDFVVRKSESLSSEINAFFKKHNSFTMNMFENEFPGFFEDPQHRTEKAKENFKRGSQLDGVLDFTRGMMESRTARFLVRMNPSATYRMPSIKNIAHHMFNKTSLVRSIPGCVALIAFNTYAPTKPFFPVLASHSYDWKFSMTKIQTEQDGDTYYSYSKKFEYE